MIDTICKHKFCAIIIIAPIARTYCDTYYAYSKSRFFSIYLLFISIGLTIASYTLGAQITKAMPDLLRDLIKNTVAHLFAVSTFGFVIHLLLASSMFAIFRGLARFVVYAAYTLGQFATFWLVTLGLTGFGAYAGISRRAQLQKSVFAFVEANPYHFFSFVVLLLLHVWYYDRYVTPSARRGRVFDHELGALLVHLRRG